MKTNHRKTFLEELSKIGIIQVACEKAGISRNTVYRWRKTNPVFAQNMDDALKEGVALVNDMAESALLNLIRNQEFSAVRFWLRCRHSAYKEQSDIKVQIEDESTKLRKYHEFRERVDGFKAKILKAQENFNVEEGD